MLGAINNVNAKSWNLSSAVLLLNSFFIAISLSMIAFILDYSPDLSILLILFNLSMFLILIGHLIMIRNFNFTLNLIKKLSKIYFRDDLIKSHITENLNFYKFDFTTFMAWICFLIGFIFPSILAVIFNEYRTTLFQLSFIFNSIGTFITIVITDKKASILSDKDNPSTIEIKVYKTIFLAKINNNGKTFFIGSNGKLTPDNAEIKDLPYIFGKPKIYEFLKFKTIIDQSKLSYNQIENIYYFPSKRWDLRLKDNILLKLPKEFTKNSLDNAYEFIKNYKFNKFTVVDFRVNNQIIVYE